MKVLIIGGTGFIGRHVTRLLIQNGHEVAVFHRNKNSDLGLDIAEIFGNRENILRFKKEFLSFKPDLAIDMIAYTAQNIWSLQQALKDVTNNLLLLSSGDVYDAFDIFHRSLPDIDNSLLRETSSLRNRLYPYRPEGPGKYDELLFNYDKIIVEKMLQRELFNTIILRLPAVFGPRDTQQKLSEYIIPMTLKQPSIKLSPKKANWIWTRSYVENVAYGIYLAATAQAVKNEIFNLGDINLRELDLVTKLKELSGWQGEIIIDHETEEPYNYSQNIQMDNSKIRQVLNYEVLISDETALLTTIEGYR
jgi:nucleoside-diphosphate-sugar epimerase